jgi:hypothetical protein
VRRRDAGAPGTGAIRSREGDMTEDPVVVLTVYSLYGLGLLSLYGAVCLVEWAGRTLLGIEWETLWDQWRHL